MVVLAECLTLAHPTLLMFLLPLPMLVFQAAVFSLLKATAAVPRFPGEGGFEASFESIGMSLWYLLATFTYLLSRAGEPQWPTDP